MRALCILLAPALILACSGSDDESGSAVAKVDGFCGEWAVRACNEDVVDRCAAAEVGDCRTAQADFCMSLVPAGKYSSAEAKTCLEAVEAAYKDAELDASEAATVLRLAGDCELILSGSGGPDDSCEEDSDCNRESGLSCVRRPGTESGTCQEAVEVGGGEECSAPEQECVDGFYCNGENCLAEKKAGAECATTMPCAAELRCQLADGTPPGPDDTEAVCVARLDVGQDCAADDDCLTGICGLVAGSDSGVCANQLILSTGEPLCAELR